MREVVCQVSHGPDMTNGSLRLVVCPIHGLTKALLDERKVFYHQATLRIAKQRMCLSAHLEGRSETWEINFDDRSYFPAVHTLQAYFPLIVVCQIDETLPCLPALKKIPLETILYDRS